jgi:hypothetical protein
MLAGLQNVEERLKAAPELVTLPHVQSLSVSVASFGSQIRDMNTTVTGLKSDNIQLQDTAKILIENVTTLKVCSFLPRQMIITFILDLKFVGNCYLLCLYRMSIKSIYLVVMFQHPYSYS